MRPRGAPPRSLAAWLLACAGCVVLVLLVGGITRLTHSGLSIVQWQPLVGAVPPLSDADWAELFARYRQSPEFRLAAPSMDLAQFRHIFWWEYAHRLLARVAAAVFAVPLLYFVVRRRIPRALAVRLLAIFALGALQGALGWYMVASGLVDEPRVDPPRLAAHLGLALLLIGALLWSAWSLRDASLGAARPLPLGAAVPAALVFCMALTGAVVAGTRAGFVFNTFPDMNGALLPDGLLQLDPWYRNFVDNLATVQFTHRAMACVLVAAALLAWTRKRGAARAMVVAMALALALQVALGIATLLSGVALPLASAHQAGAVLLFAVALRFAYVRSRDSARTAPSSKPR
jgi:cytochrome c oxidase assembly protein subunit 15